MIILILLLGQKKPTWPTSLLICLNWLFALANNRFALNNNQGTQTPQTFKPLPEYLESYYTVYIKKSK